MCWRLAIHDQSLLRLLFYPRCCSRMPAGAQDGDHLCSCAIPEASCTGDENLWTDACACMQGCFSQDTYMCDCDKTEDQCGSDGANEFWTPLCNDACMAKELGAAFTPGCLEFGEAGVHGCKCDVDE